MYVSRDMHTSKIEKGFLCVLCKRREAVSPSQFYCLDVLNLENVIDNATTNKQHI